MNRLAALEPVCGEDISDYVCLAADKREEAATRVGRVGILVIESVFEAAEVLAPLRGELAEAIRTSTSAAAAESAVERVASDFLNDDAIGDAIFIPMVMADMAGQLMARGEVPEMHARMFGMIGEAQPVDAFLNLPWEEAIREFKARGVVSPEEFTRLVGTYAERSQEARALLLQRVQERVREMLVTSLEEGQTFREFAAAIEDEAPGLGITSTDHGYLENVFRTNVQSAYGAGRYRQITDPAVATARPYVQYRTVGDARVRPSHEKLDRTVYRIDGPTWKRIAPPNGYQCFPGDTLVSGKFRAGIRALYAGDLVELVTKAGRRLRVTPNHPIATADGFVPAGELDRGDHVVCHVGLGHAPPREHVVGHVKEQHAPAPIDQVFGALRERGVVCPLWPVPDDFHGDAVRMRGEVDVVGSDGILLGKAHAAHGEQLIRRALGDTGHPDDAFVENCARDLSLGLAAGDAPAGRLVARAGLPLSGSGVHSTPLEPLCIGLAASLNTSLRKPAGDDRAADAEFIGKLLLGVSSEVSSRDGRGSDVGPVVPVSGLESGELEAPSHAVSGHADGVADPVNGAQPFVELDEVVGIDRVSWVGHVYDLESPHGWLAAGGIITSNCRCSVVTLSAEEAKGFDIIDALPEGGGPDEGFDGPPVANVEKSLL